MSRKKSSSCHISSFDMTVYLLEEHFDKTPKTVESHVHDKCEIYINLSGDVSFMVEKNIYSISRGDVIITRPYEYHHCINHTADYHDHFCIMFSCNECKNIFNIFFDRKIGEKNYISLSQLQKEKLISLCYTLVNDNSSEIKKYISFFNLIDLISDIDSPVVNTNLPEDIAICVDYINNNISKSITVRDLSILSYVSVNTLERHFKKYIGMSPYAYIQNCRLAYAVSVLENGGTVTQAAVESGFPDYSHFISLFKKRYGKTPLKFQKEL